MLYSLIVLTFGIYLGQEYSTIPLIKNIVKKTFVLFYENDADNVHKETKEKRDGEELTNLGYSEVLINSLKTILNKKE